MDPVQTQRDYYRDTANVYDGMHECPEHHMALRYMSAYLTWLGVESVLDTGCGTGLGMRAISAALPNVRVRGNDPSDALLRVAVERHGIAPDRLDCSGSETLPYADGEYDAVIETGMLHHVPRPDLVVAEMLRVADKAVFLSDSNMFGQGSLPARGVKLTLARLRLLGPVNRLRRGGNDWYYTEGDGVGWSYSIFDSYAQIREQCSEVIVMATGVQGPHADRFPLLCASHCLVAGFKEPLPPTVDRS